MRRLVCVIPVALAWLNTIFVTGEFQPRRLLPNAERLERIIHFGLFPDKPRNVSFSEYFRNFTDGNKDLEKILERLEFNNLDFENLANVIKLAEDAKRLREIKMVAIHQAEMAMAMNSTGARRAYPRHDIFHYKKMPNAWTLDTRRKVVQFMQHSMYSSKYEIGKLRNLRKKFRNSTVFQMGMLYGNNMEMKTTAARLISTMIRTPLNVSMLWFVFHYHKLLNMAFDVQSNTEMIYLLNDRIKSGNVHFHMFKDEAAEMVTYTFPVDSYEATSADPENLYKKKKK